MGSHDRLVNAAVPVGITIAALAALLLTTASRSTSAGIAAPPISTSHASYAGSPSSSPHPSTSTSTSPSPSTSTVRRNSAPETVVAVTSFAYEADAPTPTAAATVHVVTRDTAPVTLVLHFAGGNSAGAPGDNAGLDDDFTLSGHTAYTITDRVTALQYCYTRYFGVTASLKDTTGTTSFRQLASPACT